MISNRLAQHDYMERRPCRNMADAKKWLGIPEDFDLSPTE